MTAKVEVRLRGRVPQPTATYDAAVALAKRVAAHHELRRCTLVVNNNRKRVLTWRTPPTELSVHWALVAAPDQVLGVLDRDPAAWEALKERLPQPALPSLTTEGHAHDLTPLMQEQSALFEQLTTRTTPELAVTWGRWPSTAPRRRLQLGSCEVAAGLVRIHPVLDHTTVPAWFVGFILYHELLHAVHRPTRADGNARRSVHTPAFRQAEARHPDITRAEAWERRHVSELIGRCRQHVARRRRAR